MELYTNRKQAGMILADLLKPYANDKEVVVLALPRGGVPVAHEIARALHISLDVFLVRKLGIPGHKELAMGAIASGGAMVLNDHLVKKLQISPQVIVSVKQAEMQELLRRETCYRGNRSALSVKHKKVIVVDDGIATGATMMAAIQVLSQSQPKSIVVAVPVGSPRACQEIANLVHDLICPLQPDAFEAVGQWYEDFTQVCDADVLELL